VVAPMLRIYNTLTGKKEPFEPLVPKTTRMYVCGVTVYDYCHIGHARSALVFDVIRRYLEHSGYRVEFVKNFTDVDDKIIKRANEQGVSCDQITAKFIQAYYDDMGRLGVRPASIEPKATEHMAEIVRLTETLIAKGLAYQVNGDVYFAVPQYSGYGRLSKRRLDDLQAGRAWTLTSANAIRWISHSGKAPSQASLHGRVRGGRDVLVGTSSARRCR